MLPAVVTMVAATKQYAVGQLPGRVLLIVLVTLYAPINSILTIAFIAPYRRLTMRILGKVYRRIRPNCAAGGAVQSSNLVVKANVSTAVDSIQMNRVVQNRRQSHR